jgi:hypothetical protein
MSETAEQFQQPLGSGFFKRNHDCDCEREKYPRETKVCQT